MFEEELSPSAVRSSVVPLINRLQDSSTYKKAEMMLDMAGQGITNDDDVTCSIAASIEMPETMNSLHPQRTNACAALHQNKQSSITNDDDDGPKVAIIHVEPRVGVFVEVINKLRSGAATVEAKFDISSLLSFGNPILGIVSAPSTGIAATLSNPIQLLEGRQLTRLPKVGHDTVNSIFVAPSSVPGGAIMLLAVTQDGILYKFWRAQGTHRFFVEQLYRQHEPLNDIAISVSSSGLVSGFCVSDNDQLLMIQFSSKGLDLFATIVRKESSKMPLPKSSSGLPEDTFLTYCAFSGNGAYAAATGDTANLILVCRHNPEASASEGQWLLPLHYISTSPLMPYSIVPVGNSSFAVAAGGQCICFDPQSSTYETVGMKEDILGLSFDSTSGTLLCGTPSTLLRCRVQLPSVASICDSSDAKLQFEQEEEPSAKHKLEDDAIDEDDESSDDGEPPSVPQGFSPAPEKARVMKAKGREVKKAKISDIGKQFRFLSKQDNDAGAKKMPEKSRERSEQVPPAPQTAAGGFCSAAFSSSTVPAPPPAPAAAPRRMPMNAMAGSASPSTSFVLSRVSELLSQSDVKTVPLDEGGGGVMKSCFVSRLDPSDSEEVRRVKLATMLLPTNAAADAKEIATHVLAGRYDPNRPKIIALAGVPQSGKSSLARCFAASVWQVLRQQSTQQTSPSSCVEFDKFFCTISPGHATAEHIARVVNLGARVFYLDDFLKFPPDHRKLFTHQIFQRGKLFFGDEKTSKKSELIDCRNAIFIISVKCIDAPMPFLVFGEEKKRKYKCGTLANEIVADPSFKSLHVQSMASADLLRKFEIFRRAIFSGEPSLEHLDARIDHFLIVPPVQPQDLNFFAAHKFLEAELGGATAIITPPKDPHGKSIAIGWKEETIAEIAKLGIEGDATKNSIVAALSNMKTAECDASTMIAVLQPSSSSSSARPKQLTAKIFKTAPSSPAKSGSGSGGGQTSSHDGSQSSSSHASPTHRNNTSSSKLNVSIDRENPLGRGGFGCVYKGFDNETGAYVAVKEAHLTLMVAKKEELQNEYQILENLEHPNVVRVRGFTRSSNGMSQIYMEWMPGGSIGEILNKSGFRFHESTIRRYTRDALNGLAYLHEKHVVHRDIKPGNMLCTADGVVKVSDFGISKQAGNDSSGCATTVSTVGTTVYLAPECITMGKYSPASDIWALACSIVEMASGKRPWSHLPDEIAREAVPLMFHIATAVPPNNHPAIPEHLSDQLKQIIEKCFTNDPTSRQFDPKSRPSAKKLLEDPYFAQCDDLPGDAETIEAWQKAKDEFAAMQMQKSLEASSSSPLSSQWDQAKSSVDDAPTQATTTFCTS